MKQITTSAENNGFLFFFFLSSFYLKKKVFGLKKKPASGQLNAGGTVTTINK
jgi:hypothetical protein